MASSPEISSGVDAAAKMERGRRARLSDRFADVRGFAGAK